MSLSTRAILLTICTILGLATCAPSLSAEPAPPTCCAGSECDTPNAAAPAEARQFHADTFTGFFSKLFDASDYPARWFCGNWTLETGWLHVLSDVAIFGAYFAIPLVLLYFLRQRPDLPFPKIVWLFAAFILACGFGHLVEAGIFWWPVYRFSGLIKAMTATVSWATVLVLIRMTPDLLKLPSMALLGQKLQTANERLDCALEAGGIGVWQWRDENDQFEADGRALQMHGIQATDNVSTLAEFLDLLHEDDREELRTATARCVSHGTNYSVNYRIPRANGTVRYIQSHGKVLSSDDGKTRKLVGVCIDQTELTEYHAAVKKLSLVASSTRHSVVITNQAGETEWVNNAFTQLTGYSAEEAIGRKPGSLLQGPETNQETIEIVRRALQKQEQVSAELLNYAKDGHSYWIALEIEPVFDQEGRLSNFIATQIDITDQVRRTEELIEAMETAESANHAKSQFLANMSHEIRTPLNGIMGFTDLLLYDIESTEADRREYLETVRSSGEHLLALINEILDLSKIESGQLLIEKFPCSPQQILTDVISVLRPKFEEKKIQIRRHWDSDIPTQVLTDAPRLKQLLLNIVGNAIKFTQTGEVRIVARLEAEATRSRLIFDVIDTGIGIPQGKLEMIFQPFSQADSSVTRRFGGTGLGLTISRNLAELLGGSLHAESVEGLGSKFTITVDAGNLTLSSEPKPAPPEDAPTAMIHETKLPSLSGVQALVVDDGEANRRFISVVLEHAGANITMAENGQEAVDSIAEHTSDIILLDMQMPVMDGYVAAELIRFQGFTGPIIAVTAHAMQGDREKCLAAGCSGYLSKPLSREELLRTVAYALHEQRLRDADAPHDIAF
ncbi:PAS domain-containing hybrid sensor histidine kinase/response regulator [Blastopirellula marina]|uniref:histidine kinase n=1 Tax=Blastopirellula marina DSM 3645 TaxID=314230 RepID=A3ZWS7_9BACT|nr:ATP-binding protein [Blastopirellula marina]EAQ79051.1 sensory box sensor histidine kinase/response regulator [Blastopirellula marina DSM 3645]